MTRAWTTDDVQAIRAELGARFGAPLEREAAEVDFGRLIRRPALAVIAPRSAEEVERVVLFAHDRGLKLTARGRGMSQGGQSIPEGRVSLDLSQMIDVDAPDAASMTVRCSAGTTWRAVIDAASPHGLLPKVAPLNLDLTVGGLLSVAGVGATSHTYGAAVSCVAELDVVTGSGARLTCSEERERDVYCAVLGGLGRAGIIVGARVELRRFKPKSRTFHLLYDAIEPWLRDQRALIEAGRADYLEGFCSPCIQGLRTGPRGRVPLAQWFYALHVTVEHEAGSAPEAREILAGLEPYRLVHVDDTDTLEYMARYDSRFAAMRRSGSWDQPHPWVEAFLPSDNAHEILAAVLEVYPLAFGDGPRFLFVNRRRVPPFLRMPAGREVGCMAILPVGVPSHVLPDALEALRMIHDRVVSRGGKRVLSGWIAMMDELALREHYGEQDTAWITAKRALDPKGVLDGALVEPKPQL